MLNEIISNNVLWLVMITVNVLLGGLSLVLPKKQVLGINYEDYLNHSYKVKGILLHHIRTAVSALSIVSLLWLVIPGNSIREWYFYVLTVCTVFHIVYAIRYEILINKKVKTAIYKSEFSGLYLAYDNLDTKYSDMTVKNGMRTEKTLSPEVIRYFGTYNSETIKTFHEIFAPSSFLYEHTAAYKKDYQKEFNGSPCEYKSKSGSYYLPYEFIELFQQTPHQSEWSLEILKLLNCDHQTIDNLVLLLASVRLMGQQQELFTVEFLMALNPYFMTIANEEVIKVKIPSRIVRENKLLRELHHYILMTLERDNSIRFFREAINLYKSFFNAHGYMSHQECMVYVNYLMDQSKVLENERIGKFISEFCEAYINNNSYRENNEQTEEVLYERVV
ncbi:MAG: hypothetical protein JEZ08_17800 [Clostridiales bacterium]|nr:hypothetical protein [Clostridiales bacterium]